MPQEKVRVVILKEQANGDLLCSLEKSPELTITVPKAAVTTDVMEGDVAELSINYVKDAGTIISIQPVILMPRPTPKMDDKVIEGKAFLASTANLIATRLQFIRMTFSNPAGSGKVARIARLVILATQGPVFLKLIANPTQLTVEPVRSNNLYFGHPAPAKCQLRADVAATGFVGGLDTGTLIPIPANVREPVELPSILVPPGLTLGLVTTDLTTMMTGATVNLLTSLYWWEDAQ